MSYHANHDVHITNYNPTKTKINDDGLYIYIYKKATSWLQVAVLKNLKLMINIIMFTSIFSIQSMRKTKEAGYGGFC